MNAHPSTSRARSLLLLLLLPAAVVPFVPFASGTSPWEVAAGFLRTVWHGEGNSLVLLAAPFFLGPLIVLWQFRRGFARPSAAWERRLIYALASASAAMNLLLYGSLLRDDPPFLGLTGLSVLLVCAALLRWLGRKAPAEKIPSAALALAYLDHVALPLVAFSQDRAVGWWLTLVAATSLVAQLALLVRRTLAAHRLTAEQATVRGEISPAGSTPASS